jgi:hypothetical protein
VLLEPASPFLRELVTSVLAPEIPIDVLGALATRQRLAVRIREHAPDIVLLGLGEGEVEAMDPLLLKAAESLPDAALGLTGASGLLSDG